MAPIITAVEFMLRPMDAINIARINIHILVPWSLEPDNIEERISSGEPLSHFKLNTSLNLACIFSEFIYFITPLIKDIFS